MYHLRIRNGFGDGLTATKPFRSGWVTAWSCESRFEFQNRFVKAGLTVEDVKADHVRVYDGRTHMKYRDFVIEFKLLTINDLSTENRDVQLWDEIVDVVEEWQRDAIETEEALDLVTRIIGMRV